ncbi:MAG: enzyme of heme biosynthesis [Rikenellaceae bacterium]
MKRIKLLFALTLAAITGATAQVDFSDPAYAKWGENAEEREQNMFAATYMKEAIESKDYETAAKYFQQLMANCPAASEAVFARAVVLYKAKISRATSLSDKREMIDSLMVVHDLRAEHFADHATRGAGYVLDSKARDFFNFNKNDRAGLREVFKAAIAAGGEKVDPNLVYLYFQNLCEDYQIDEVMADEVIAEYDRLGVYFENLEGENAELASKFDSTFGTSGVASCENLEAIYSKKLEANPGDEKQLAQAVRLMDRAGCTTPFYAATAEKYYEVSPTSQAAMALASIFQNDGEYEKAVKYLTDALAAETDMEEQEALYARIALIQMAASNMSEALTAARASLAIEDDTIADNGIALFVIAQCYAASAANCPDFKGQIAYLAAYDAMQRAINNFTEEEATYKEHATTMMNQYRAYFPTSEECFFNEVAKGSSYKVDCGVAAGTMTTIRTRD